MKHRCLILAAVVRGAALAAQDADVCRADSTCRKLAAAGDVFIQSPAHKLQLVGAGLAEDTQDIESTRAMEDLLQREQVAEINMLEAQLRQEQAQLGLVEQRLGQVERELVHEDRFQHPVQEQSVLPGLLAQEQTLQPMPGGVQLPPLQAAQFAQGVQFAQPQPTQILQAIPPAQGVRFAPLQAAQVAQAMPAAQGLAPQLQQLQGPPGWLQPMVNNVLPQVAPLQGIQLNPAGYAGLR